MAIEVAILRKSEVETDPNYQRAAEFAESIRCFMSRPEVLSSLEERHVIGASSAGIQEIILEAASTLGFQSEKKGLFSEYQVSGIRPDYYCPVGDTGILLEVERGKTTTNNMDILDLWKCHICKHASYLFLVVPHFRPSSNGSRLHQFSSVRKRLSPFFVKGNYVNVDAVFLFGY